MSETTISVEEFRQEARAWMEANLERRGELAAVVEQVHVQEQEWPAHIVVAHDLGPLAAA